MTLTKCVLKSPDDPVLCLSAANIKNCSCFSRKRCIMKIVSRWVALKRSPKRPTFSELPVSTHSDLLLQFMLRLLHRCVLHVEKFILPTPGNVLQDFLLPPIWMHKNHVLVLDGICRLKLAVERPLNYAVRSQVINSRYRILGCKLVSKIWLNFRHNVSLRTSHWKRFTYNLVIRLFVEGHVSYFHNLTCASVPFRVVLLYSPYRVYSTFPNFSAYFRTSTSMKAENSLSLHDRVVASSILFPLPPGSLLVLSGTIFASRYMLSESDCFSSSL